MRKDEASESKDEEKDKQGCTSEPINQFCTHTDRKRERETCNISFLAVASVASSIS